MVPWRPSNSNDGEAFMDALCNRCQHDHAAHVDRPEDGCPILCRGLSGDQPDEWVAAADDLWNGNCTAFTNCEDCNPTGDNLRAAWGRPPEPTRPAAPVVLDGQESLL